MENTKWYKWKDRNNIPNKDQPAVYYIAYSKNDISNQEFTCIEETIYIGMTISLKGLKGRLDQFEYAMNRTEIGIHGGADRVKFKHKKPEIFFNNAYISARIYPLLSKCNTPDDLRIKGDCVGDEYKAIAEYLEKYNHLPEFNDQKKSRKK